VQNAVVNQVAEYVRDLKGRYTRGIELADLEASMRKEYENTFRVRHQRPWNSLA